MTTVSSVLQIDAALEDVNSEISLMEQSLQKLFHRKENLQEERYRLVEQERLEEEAAAGTAVEEEYEEEYEEEVYYEEEEGEEKEDAGVEERRQQEERIADLKRQIEAVQVAARTAEEQKAIASVAAVAIPSTVVATRPTTPKHVASPSTPKPTPKVVAKHVAPKHVAAQQQPNEPVVTDSPESPKKKKGWKKPGWMGGSKGKVRGPHSPGADTSPVSKPKAQAKAPPSPEPLPMSAKPKVQANAPPSPEPTNAKENYTPPDLSPVKGHSEQAKQKHQWERPAWAMAADAAPDDQAIITEPIQNGLKQNTGNGYSRRVFSKDLDKLGGQFIKHTDNIPAPRLAWIVINLDGDKIGKIVMNLEGKDVDKLVDQFLELKGLEMERTKDGSLLVNNVEPKLLVSPKSIKPTRGNKNPNVIGVIQEGHEFFDAVKNAGPECVVSIKQAHIYPVKKAKGMFSS